MFQIVSPGPFLRRVLWLDAGVSAVVGVVMAAAAGVIEGLTRLPASLLVPAGLALLPYAAYLVWLATRPAVPAAAVWVPIGLNLVWALDCAAFAIVGQPAPNAFGLVFLAVQAMTVLLFAEFEFIGLRRRGEAVAAR